MYRLITCAFVFISVGCGATRTTSEAVHAKAADDSTVGQLANGDNHTRSERELILDQVIRDLLTNRLLDHHRNWYGTSGLKTVGLSTKSTVPWPKGYVPAVPGYTFEYLDPDRDRDLTASRQLGITMHHFVFPPPTEPLKDDLYHGYPIAVGGFNIGGDGNGYAPGGFLVHYQLEKSDEKWIVKFGTSIDP